MNDLIVAALIFLGVVASPDQVTQKVVDSNKIEIEQTVTDPEFQYYYQTSKTPTIGNVDTWEGD